MRWDKGDSEVLEYLKFYGDFFRFFGWANAKLFEYQENLTKKGSTFPR